MRTVENRVVPRGARTAITRDAPHGDICDLPLARPRIQADLIGSLTGTAPACWSRVAAPSTSYEPRCPAQGTLYQIVYDHFETFRAQASLRDGEGLPWFVEQEFRDFLQCGWLAGGYVVTNYASPSTRDTGTGDRDPSPSPSAGTVARGIPRRKK